MPPHSHGIKMKRGEKKGFKRRGKLIIFLAENSIIKMNLLFRWCADETFEFRWRSYFFATCNSVALHFMGIRWLLTWLFFVVKGSHARRWPLQLYLFCLLSSFLLLLNFRFPSLCFRPSFGTLLIKNVSLSKVHLLSIFWPTCCCFRPLFAISRCFAL